MRLSVTLIDGRVHSQNNRSRSFGNFKSQRMLSIPTFFFMYLTPHPTSPQSIKFFVPAGDFVKLSPLAFASHTAPSGCKRHTQLNE